MNRPTSFRSAQRMAKASTRVKRILIKTVVQEGEFTVGQPDAKDQLLRCRSPVRAHAIEPNADIRPLDVSLKGSMLS
jgi:hypothetical protein